MRNTVLKKGVLILVLGLIVGISFKLTQIIPKSISVLAQMSSEDRINYLNSQETSNVVGYYCGPTVLPDDVELDIEKSLREVHGVIRCESGDVIRIVPRANKEEIIPKPL